MKKKFFLIVGVLMVVVIAVFLFHNNDDKEVVLKDEIYLDYGNSFPTEIEYYVESGDVSSIKKYQFDYKYENIDNTNIPKEGVYNVKVVYQIKNKEFEKNIIVIVR